MSAPEKLAVPDEVRALLRERRHGYSLPAGFYQSENVYALALDRVFGRCWMLVGHTSQIPENGDFLSTN